MPANIKSIDFTKDDYVIIIYKNDKAEKITRAEAEKRGITAPAPANLLIKGPESNFLVKGSEPDSVLLFVDGVEMPASEIKKINSDIIESITVLRNWDAVEKYGEKGRRSVIEIKTKARQAADSSGGGHNIIFHKVEVEASFPGGANALVKYINNTLNKNIDDLKKEGKSGTCLIQFIVDKDGSIREAEALTMKGTKLAEIVINAINNGPKWNPAVQNGIKVTSYRKQPVTFTVANS